MEVIPAINCHRGDFRCIEQSLRKIRGFAKNGWVHVDVADGRFAFTKSGSPTDWANLRAPFELEVHLMVEEPEKHIEAWIAVGAKRLIVHAETLNEKTATEILRRSAKRGIKVMLGSKPLTTTVELWPLLKHFSHFQVLAVDPGLSGQKFIHATLKKIKFLRNFAPTATIEVDGGINHETGKLAKAAGANILVAASYILESNDPKKAYESLKKI